MHEQNPPEAEIQVWLQTLGIDALCQWDTLVFLYRHQTCLIGADHLARLMGHATEQVVAALDVLESAGLVERSRVSQGARLYQFTVPSVPPGDEAFRRLLDLADDRAGRVRLSNQLRRNTQTPNGALRAARGSVGQAYQPDECLRPAEKSDLPEAGQAPWAAQRWIQNHEEEGKPWRKAI